MKDTVTISLQEYNKLRDFYNKSKKPNEIFEQFKSIYLKNKDVSKTKLSDKLGVSRQTIYRYVKKLEK